MKSNFKRYLKIQKVQLGKFTLSRKKNIIVRCVFNKIKTN